MRIKHRIIDCTSLYCYTTLTWLQMCFDLPADRGAQLSLPCHTWCLWDSEEGLPVSQVYASLHSHTAWSRWKVQRSSLDPGNGLPNAPLSALQSSVMRWGSAWPLPAKASSLRMSFNSWRHSRRIVASSSDWIRKPQGGDRQHRCG